MVLRFPSSGSRPHGMQCWNSFRNYSPGDCRPGCRKQRRMSDCHMYCLYHCLSSYSHEQWSRHRHYRGKQNRQSSSWQQQRVHCASLLTAVRRLHPPDRDRYHIQQRQRPMSAQLAVNRAAALICHTRCSAAGCPVISPAVGR
jgi:hypothetical protein